MTALSDTASPLTAPAPARGAGAWLVPALGLLAGAFVQLDWLAALTAERLTLQDALWRVGLSALAGAALLGLSRRLVLTRVVPRLPPRGQAALRSHHALTYAVFLLPCAGATGLRLPGPLLPLLLGALFLAANVALAARADPELRHRAVSSPGYLALLFFVSGVAALIYQVTWQRLLFASFGVNIESVTLIVTVFMFGLGLGSLLGGLLSRRGAHELPRLFLLCELAVGVFGLISVPLIKVVGALMVGSSSLATGVALFALLTPPTLLMGATLPILVAYAHEHYQNVGRTVGLLYFVNTLGSAAACYLTADVLFVLGGQQSAVLCAAAFNLLVALGVQGYARAVAGRAPAPSPAPPLVREEDAA